MWCRIHLKTLKVSLAVFWLVGCDVYPPTVRASNSRWMVPRSFTMPDSCTRRTKSSRCKCFFGSSNLLTVPPSSGRARSRSLSLFTRLIRRFNSVRLSAVCLSSAGRESTSVFTSWAGNISTSVLYKLWKSPSASTRLPATEFTSPRR